MRLDCAIEFELRDPAQVLAQDFFLDLELMLVAGMLIVASAAAGEVWARRQRAVRGGLENLVGLGAREAGFLFGGGGFDFLSGKNEGNEYGLAASTVAVLIAGRAITGRAGGKTSESVAAVDQLFNV